MAEWKKVLVSGSNIEVNQITGSGDADIQGTLSIGGIADVSASIAAAGSAITAGDGLFKNGGTLSVDSGSLIIKADNTEIQAQITSNQTVGGIASGESFTAGTDVEDLLRQILISYIQPTITLDSVKNSGATAATTREVGDGLTLNQIQYDAAADDPDGDLIQNVGFASSGADTNFALNLGTNPLTAGNNQTLSITTQTINKTSAGTVQFTISGSDADGAVISDTLPVYYRVRTVFGGSSVDLNNSSQQSTDVQTIYNAIKSQRSSLSRTTADFTTTGNTTTDNNSNYTYYMYNSSFNDLAQYTQAGFTSAIGGAYTKIGTTFTVTNDEGESVSLKVYQSNGTQAVNNNQEIVFID